MKLEWRKEQEDCAYDFNFSADLPPGVVNVGYYGNMIRLAYRCFPIYEYILIEGGKISSYNRKKSASLEDPLCPEVLTRHFRQIAETIPDETAQKLLTQISEDDIKKISLKAK